MENYIIDAKLKPSVVPGQFKTPEEGMEWLSKQSIARTKPTVKGQRKFLATADDPMAQMARQLYDTKAGVCIDMAALPAVIARENDIPGGMISMGQKGQPAKHAIAWWADKDGTISVSSNQGYKKKAFKNYNEMDCFYKRAFGSVLDAPADFLDSKGRHFKTAREEQRQNREFSRALHPLANHPMIVTREEAERQADKDLEDFHDDRDGIRSTE